ncbi:hypothetical protein QBC46DRAFT_101586 [Diplogelasinospora grovesii]|uniref:Bacteriophage T5 Orf172 DNA-binding domain-containing protein n=1 Tax=Diplogelasinospora grovesii TaxID=303347 RepID=A0AAN6MWZ6_9PEZI|nr:hypothetical protein QBC46DRAFT_101586 [Diplogelasinospora grovesii]
MQAIHEEFARSRNEAERLARQFSDLSLSQPSVQISQPVLTSSHSSHPRMLTATQAELDRGDSLLPDAGISESNVPQSDSETIWQQPEAPVGSANSDPSPSGNQEQGLTTYSFASFQRPRNDLENRYPEQLKRAMKLILKPDVIKVGYVYCSITMNRPYLLHVGTTAFSPEEFDLRRRRPYIKGCHYDRSTVLFHYKAVHYKRVEHLVHATLIPWRWVVYCKGCGRKHPELFNITPENAAAVVEKWKTWAEMGPYDEEKLEEQWQRLSTGSRQPGDKLQSLLETISHVGLSLSDGDST